MKYQTIYVVFNEGEVQYASVNEEDAEGFATTRGLEGRQHILEEWGNDDPSETEIAEADFQAGFDGYCYEVEAVNLSGLTEEDTVELLDGTVVDVSDILAKMDDDDLYDDEEDDGTYEEEDN